MVLQRCQATTSDGMPAASPRHDLTPWTAALLCSFGTHLPSSLRSSDLNPQETLLHFSARRGLLRVTRFLLQQAGARGALRLANRQGFTPSAVAESRGHECLRELLAK